MVADVVVGVREEVGADGGRKDFGAVVIDEGGGNGQDARCPSRARRGAREGVGGIVIRINRQ